MAYIIQAVNGRSKHNVDNAATRDEAQALVEEYELTLGPSFRVTYREASGANGRKRRPL
jgi:hypothetical protein